MKTNNNIVAKLNALITICNMTDSVKSETLKKELESIIKELESGNRKDYGEFDLKKAKEMAKGLKLEIKDGGDGKHCQVVGEDTKKMVDIWHQLDGRFYRVEKCWSFKNKKLETLKQFIK